MAGESKHTGARVRLQWQNCWSSSSKWLMKKVKCAFWSSCASAGTLKAPRLQRRGESGWWQMIIGYYVIIIHSCLLSDCGYFHIDWRSMSHITSAPPPALLRMWGLFTKNKYKVRRRVFDKCTHNLSTPIECKAPVMWCHQSSHYWCLSYSCTWV